MNRKKLVLLGVFLVLAISWGSLAQASQIGINYGIYNAGEVYSLIQDPLGVQLRVYYSGLNLGGTLVGTPSAPGPFSQQIAVQGNLGISIGMDQLGFSPWKGSDFETVSLAFINAGNLFWVDNTEPFPFTDARCSISFVTQNHQNLIDGVAFQNGWYEDNKWSDYVMFSGMLDGQAVVPFVWQNEAEYHWCGQGFVNLPLNFIVSLNGNVASPPVPIPSAVLLLGSGLLRLACYKRRKKS